MKTLFALLLLCSTPTWAAENQPATPVDPSPEGEAVDVSKVTEKYWAQGKDTELGVVQNRKYTNEHRLELDLFTGTISTDPFLTVHQFGGSLGYYFTQNFSVHVTAWKDSVSNSDAYTQALLTNTKPDINPPKSFYGVELDQNFLYGKASLFGASIIYVDIYALGGVGTTNTTTGNNFTEFVGIGQKIHLNQLLAIDLDYRIMHFNETVPSSSGGIGHDRTNNTDAITLGLCLFY